MAKRIDPPEDSEPDLPSRIGPYLCKERLSKGGFGVVHRAVHAEDGAPAALKIIHAELASSPAMVARFEREIEAIRRVNHPSVVRVLDQGRLPDGRPYFAMELLSGEDLHAHLTARGRLPVEEALAILEPLCSAVAAAHARAIIHRDIKASNVMLAEDGGKRRIVLLDFGIAKLLDDDGPKLTASRHLVGTLSCMAPEQLLSKPVDERTDVYALGILTYRMLTGQGPFVARSALALQQMHLAAAPRPPSSLVQLPPSADAAVLRALSKAPADRHSGPMAFFEDLRAGLLSEAAVRLAPRPVLAVLVEARAPADALDAPSDALLADLESILPRAAEELASVGLRVALETGTTLLLAAERPTDMRADLRFRRGVLVAALSLHERLRARPGADPAVSVRFAVHSGLLAMEAGEAPSGPLLDIEAWLPEGETPGFIASREVLESLPHKRVALGGTDGEWWALDA